MIQGILDSNPVVQVFIIHFTDQKKKTLGAERAE